MSRRVNKSTYALSILVTIHGVEVKHNRHCVDSGLSIPELDQDTIPLSIIMDSEGPGLSAANKYAVRTQHSTQGKVNLH
jgi:hypothetical protein